MGHLTVTVVDHEKHNFQYMFSLFKTAKHIYITYIGVKVTLLALQEYCLGHSFQPTELRDISWSMLMALESYTAAEEASVESFLETYVGVVMETAKLERSLHMNVGFAIKTLSLRRGRIDDGYKKNLVSNNTYIQFYRVLAQYYKENGQERNAALCHAHILATIHDQLDHCYPHCDYFSISVAYENIVDSIHAFQFRELAYKHQWSSLSPMHQAKLCIDLYNDYSNESLGNSTSQADQFSSIITKNVYEYLLRATGSEYLEDVYYDAIDFFRAKNMKGHVYQLQFRMYIIIKRRCDWRDLLECSLHFSTSASRAWERQCYHLTIWSGEKCLLIWNKLNLALFITSKLLNQIGQSYYQIGNYSDAQIWLKRALKIVNEDLNSWNRGDDRVSACYYLLLSGDYFNVFCYGYIIKDLMCVLSIVINEYAHKDVINSSKQQPEAETVILSTETGVTEEKYSFVWSQFNHYVHKFYMIYTIEKFISRAEKVVSQLVLYINPFLLWCLSLILSEYAVYFVIFNLICHLISLCCFEQQTVCTITLKFIITSCFLTLVVFVLGLDWLY